MFICNFGLKRITTNFCQKSLIHFCFLEGVGLDVRTNIVWFPPTCLFQPLQQVTLYLLFQSASVLFRYFTENALECLRTEILTTGTTQSVQDILELEHRCRDEAMQLVQETFKNSKMVYTTENNIKEISSKTCEEIKEKEIKLAILQVPINYIFIKA